jgi:branched-chain amino acid transport system substrate-binding protein
MNVSIPSRLALVCALAVSVLPLSATAVAQPIEIPVVLSLTGAGAFVGTAQWRSIQVAQSVINTQGGFDGKPVNFVVHDDESTPRVAVELTQSIIASKPLVILGPSLAASCNAMSALVAQSGPVLYCLTAGVKPDAGSYVFSTMAASQDMLAVALRNFRERGWKRIAYLMTTDASGQDGTAGITSALAAPENRGLRVVAHESFTTTDLSVAAQLVRIKAAQPDVIIAWVIGTSVGTVLRGIADAGLTTPVLISSGNMTGAFVKQYGSLLNGDVYAPGMTYYAGSAVSDNATRSAIATMVAAMNAANVQVDQLGISSWDPAMLLIDTLRKLGPGTDPAKLRDAIARTRGWTGVNGPYDFAGMPQRGIGRRSVVMVRFDPAKQQFIPTSKLGGALDN